MGRNVTIRDDDRIVIRTDNAQTKLQQGSERRALLNVVINNGGSMTMGEINTELGYECRSKIKALINAGWLAIDEQQAAA